MVVYDKSWELTEEKWSKKFRYELVGNTKQEQQGKQQEQLQPDKLRKPPVTHNFDDKIFRSCWLRWQTEHMNFLWTKIPKQGSHVQIWDKAD